MVFCAPLLLCACQRAPESYPPPAQFHSAPPPNPDVMVDFGEPGAAEHIVKDIDPLIHGSWVWTGQQPTLKILTPSTAGLKLSVDFTLYDEGFRHTGPVELKFSVNGRDLDAVRYGSPGHKHFEKPVPPDWLSTDVEAVVSISIDKLYAGTDGKKFGFILSRIGFRR